jgi:hypothetical protein
MSEEPEVAGVPQETAAPPGGGGSARFDTSRLSALTPRVPASRPRRKVAACPRGIGYAILLTGRSAMSDLCFQDGQKNLTSTHTRAESVILSPSASWRTGGFRMTSLQSRPDMWYPDASG